MGDTGTGEIRLWCPSCGTQMEVPFGALLVECANCGRKVDLSKRASGMAVAAARSTTAMAEGMAAAVQRGEIDLAAIEAQAAEAKRAAEAAVKARYVPRSAQPAKNPACGPRVAPLNAYTDPACA